MNELFFRRAIELAKNGLAFTSPNPIVGAVLVYNGEIIAEGWHKKAGVDHAELMAIKNADRNLLSESDLYVTLEPCSHFGKTPPCADMIVKSGIKKVFIGMTDPFERVNGSGIKYLRKNGVDVELLDTDTELAMDIRFMNQRFIKWAKYKLPYVVLKAGVSLDGKIATYENKSKWITNEKSRDDARIERSLCDAVLVGANTVRFDDCSLNVYSKFGDKKLLRVIIDKDLSLDLDFKVFRDENVFVATSEMASKERQSEYRKMGVSFKVFAGKRVLILDLLKYLYSIEVQSVFVEGGSSVHGSFYDAFLKDERLIDKLLFYYSPILIGGKGSFSVIGGKGAADIVDLVRLKNIDIEKLDLDIKYSGVFNLY